MARRNQGPKLQYLKQRGAFYVTWTVNGRSRKCSTGTADSEQAQEFFTEWLVSHGERKANGPRDPSQVLISEILNDYLLEAKPSATARAAYAVPPLDAAGAAIFPCSFCWASTLADVKKRS